jgi:hypothetical protein
VQVPYTPKIWAAAVQAAGDALDISDVTFVLEKQEEFLNACSASNVELMKVLMANGANGVRGMDV